jgi:hypothetical protein
MYRIMTLNSSEKWKQVSPLNIKQQKFGDESLIVVSRFLYINSEIITFPKKMFWR